MFEMVPTAEISINRKIRRHQLPEMVPLADSVTSAIRFTVPTLIGRSRLLLHNPTTHNSSRSRPPRETRIVPGVRSKSQAVSSVQSSNRGYPFINTMRPMNVAS